MRDGFRSWLAEVRAELKRSVAKDQVHLEMEAEP
jgi:hypothetical protein